MGPLSDMYQLHYQGGGSESEDQDWKWHAVIGCQQLNAHSMMRVPNIYLIKKEISSKSSNFQIYLIADS